MITKSGSVHKCESELNAVLGHVQSTHLDLGCVLGHAWISILRIRELRFERTIQKRLVTILFCDISHEETVDECGFTNAGGS